jgi:hypothetical protein
MPFFPQGHRSKSISLCFIYFLLASVGIHVELENLSDARSDVIVEERLKKRGVDVDGPGEPQTRFFFSPRLIDVPLPMQLSA